MPVPAIVEEKIVPGCLTETDPLFLCSDDLQAFLGLLVWLWDSGNLLNNREVPSLPLQLLFFYCLTFLSMFILHVLADMNELAYLCVHTSQICVSRSEASLLQS